MAPGDNPVPGQDGDPKSGDHLDSNEAGATATLPQPDGGVGLTYASDGGGQGPSGGGVPAKPPTHAPYRPHTADAIHRQLYADWQDVEWRADCHDVRAARWDFVSSITKMTLAVTAAVSALTVVADSLGWATFFAIVTAFGTALNAGFSPTRKATQHSDSARAYHHLNRPLDELLFLYESCFGIEYLPQTGYANDEYYGYYDSRYYRITQTPSPSDLTKIWDGLKDVRQRIESIDEAAPSLASPWRRQKPSPKELLERAQAQQAGSSSPQPV
jgi:hypothetical protein